ncbi:LOW QUALITY PROTEIN: importin-4-like [Lepeophtheirus salmonis]|uniref:LOW QUALITY PROTEIN: importin-4-like n=1 Tax=Lepeophtheirus salmonis TaxID=72036 RepID=UPI001AE760A0|nr:LOW QUALITY PROTEIN: importin-4-like [Lepeophtheirus salmonis]
MEQILENLLVPDSETIKTATASSKKRFKSPEATQELCNALATSSNPQVRQYSAVLLKRKLSSSNFPDVIKNGLLETLSKESERSVAKSIAILIAMGTKKGPWPELNAFIETGLSGDGIGQTLWLISVLSEVAPEFIPVANLVPKMKESLSNPENGFYSIKTLTNVLPSASEEYVPFIQPLIPSILDFVSKLAPTEGERAAEALDILDELLESEIPFASPFIGPMTELCISLASQNTLEESLRVKAIAFLGRITRFKKKTVVKQKLYIPMINTLFPIMCSLEDDDLYEDDDDERSPEVCASQTLDVLAVNLPPAKFMNTLMQNVKPALESTNRPDLMKGALTAISVSAEGCAEHIRTHYLTYFLNSIGSGIRHNSHPAVKSAAFYALGQMSEYLQPDISKFSGEILPVLFEVLDNVIADVLERGKEESQKGLDRVFYALEEFCENMDEELVPILPELMRRLITMIDVKFKVSTREVVMSAIAAAATATKEAIVPYFDTIMNILKGYLVYKEEDQDAQNLLTQSMYTLGVIARAVSDTGAFGSALAQECVNLGIQLINSHDDPDVRKSAYALFASVAYVVKEEMAPVLPQIVDRMMKSLQSMDELALEFNEEDELFQELDDDEEVDLTVDNIGDETKRALESIKAVSVENSYMDEKEQAILAFKDLVKYIGPAAFAPYLAELTEEVYTLLDFPFETIRQASASAMATLLFAAPDLNNALGMLVPKLCKMICEDEEVPVVCSCLESLAEILKGDAPIRNQPELIKAIAECVRNVMNQSYIGCIDTSTDLNDVDDEEEEEDAEQEEMLFEYAGDVLPNLGRALDPQTFAAIFNELFPLFLKKTKKHCSNAEKSFAVGSLAECMEPMKGVLDPYVSKLYQTYAAMTQEKNEDVRNNAIFGMGEMCLYGGPCTYPVFPQILQLLSSLLSGQESSPRIVDQIVGAVCRMILANDSLIPLTDVFPVVIQNLPLKEDHEEFLSVYRAVLHLIPKGSIVKDNLQPLLLSSVAIEPKKVGEISKLEPVIIEFWRTVAREYSSEFNTILQTMDPNTAQKISMALS